MSYKQTPEKQKNKQTNKNKNSQIIQKIKLKGSNQDNETMNLDSWCLEWNTTSHILKRKEEQVQFSTFSIHPQKI